MAAEIVGSGLLSPDRLIPDLLRHHPEAREILDGHGLQGCGGRLGPHETLGFFARAHGVDIRDLLDELADAVAISDAAVTGDDEGPAAPEVPTLADTSYRLYVFGALVLTLTAGATWGAWMLWMIGRGGPFRAASLNLVNAHGEAQLYGWAGPFIMGIAYQAFPRFWHTRLPTPRMAAWAFALMFGVLIVRTVGMAAAGTWRPALA